MELKFQVQMKIRRPVAEVFAAVVDPDKLSGYFVERSSGPLVEGATVMWKFPELGDSFPVVVRQVIAGERLVFEWEASEGGYNTTVEIVFRPLDAHTTMVQVQESGWRDSPASLKSSHDNAGGWMHMLTCLKAYLEYGINLRAGGVF